MNLPPFPGNIHAEPRDSTFDLGLTVDVADDVETGNTSNIKSAISAYWDSVMDGIDDNRVS